MNTYQTIKDKAERIEIMKQLTAVQLLDGRMIYCFDPQENEDMLMGEFIYGKSGKYPIHDFEIQYLDKYTTIQDIYPKKQVAFTYPCVVFNLKATRIESRGKHTKTFFVMNLIERAGRYEADLLLAGDRPLEMEKPYPKMISTIWLDKRHIVFRKSDFIIREEFDLFNYLDKISVWSFMKYKKEWWKRV